MIDKNYDFFKKEEKKLKEIYPNEFIVICNQEVVFHDVDLNKAIEYARTLEAGSYIIQRCETNETRIVQVFHTRVSF